MSVFRDFLKVWGQRHPGIKLPTGWVEGVRANLGKNKQKVAVLKEELEKVQFYVDYLERLLADFEKDKNAKKAAKEENSVIDPQHGEKDHHRDGSSLAKKSSMEERLSMCEDTVFKCITELSQSMTEALQSAEEEEDEEEVVEFRRSSEPEGSTARQRSHTFSDASNYVTVIEVNGMNRAAKALSSFEPPRPTNQNQKVPKKVPPKPPPKTFQYKPKDKEDTSSSDSTGKKSNDSSLERKLSDSEVLEDASKKVEAPQKVDAAVQNTETLARRQAEAEDTRQLVEAADMIAAAVQDEEDGETGEAVPTAPGEEPLYDQVPMDAEGDYVYLSTSGPTNGTASQDKAESGGSMGSMSDLDGETTMKSQASGYSACSSETGTTDTEPGPAAATPPPESPKRSNYVNIDYFIKQRGPSTAGRGRRADSVESDDDVPPLMRTISSEPEDEEDGPRRDEIFRQLNDNKYASSSSLDATPSVTSHEWRWPKVKPPPGPPHTVDPACSKEEAERLAMWRCIVASIIESETIFIGCLNVLLQYMKAIRATLKSSQPIMSEEDFDTIFFKVPELYNMHQAFLEGLKKAQDSSTPCVGEYFRMMASQINEYGAFLHNYGRATDAVRKCKQNNAQFAQTVHSIPLRSKGSEQRLSLEDLLHKPVARVQKNALVLHDLLKYTPESHHDHKTLTEALNMNQSFLDEFNMIQTKSMFPSADRAQRRLVKNSFIVELSDGHRKLRHLFLFNDVIACAKYKASGREKFTFELKWYIALSDIVVYEEFAAEPRETSPANIVALKSAACTVRDQILWQERQLDEKRQRHSSVGRGTEKQRKKLADLEAQLVLASPNLVFRVAQKNQRPYTFFLSSEFERTQWIDAIHNLQASQLPGPSVTVGMDELQAWITACRTFLKTDMGSYLLRSGRDESLLLGDLHVRVCRLRGLDGPADLAVCLEIDSYGHYFRKARTKLVCGSATPVWDEEFIIELEGSQNLRVLLYEETAPRPVLRGRATQMLSRSWLSEQRVLRTLTLQGCELELMLRFVPSEVTLRRVPTAKTAGLFGAKIQHVCKRQKRPVPFIITSCVREVERRGINEVGIYRVSGSASDLTRLKKSFETNSYEAEQLLKEVDVHSVTGVLKLYLRELPEALFTDELYPRLFEIFNNPTLDATSKRRQLLIQFQRLPTQNQHIIVFLLAHMAKIHQSEVANKMSLHNLATVFGPTLLRPGSTHGGGSRHRDALAAGTVDVMAQAGILYHFLQSFMAGEIRSPAPPSPAPAASSALSSLSSSSSMAS